MSDGSISVIIPVYNGCKLFRKTLESVLIQSYSNMEILVVDDGSEMDIKSVVHKMNDDRLSYHRLAHSNANVARNHGIKMAKGTYIAMLDADDLWMPRHVEVCLKKINESQADAIYGSLIVRNLALGTEQPVIIHGPKEHETMMNYLLRTGYGAQTSTLFMTAASAKDILWDETLLRHQDYDFVVRYSKRYRMVADHSEPTVIYNHYPKGSKIDLRSCIKVINRNFNDIDPEIYMAYNYNMLTIALEQQEEEIASHYRRESTLRKEYINFVKFLQIRSPKNAEQVEQLRKEYCDCVSAFKVE